MNMALGTRYVRNSMKEHCRILIGMQRLDEGWTMEQVGQEWKTLRYKKVSEIQDYYKKIKK